MRKNKRSLYFDSIENSKVKFEKLSTDYLKKRLSQGSLLKEAAVAIRQILEERKAC